MPSEKSQAVPVGAALVVGGGIGGMQAALDLANGGIKVYLAERGPAIGGVMAQLDKTFPTNDCAMCTMAPRLVEMSFGKWSHMVYRPLALYFLAVREKAARMAPSAEVVPHAL